MHSVITHACVAKGKKEIVVEQRELKYSDDEVVVKVECGGICGSDIHYYHEGRAGLSVIKQPLVIGHEFVGRIFHAPAASGLQPGQKVAINPSQPCGRCEYCQAGKQNACATMRFMGSAQFTPHVDGGFAQYVVVPAQQCVAYDEQVPASIMSVAEPTAVVIHALNVAGSVVGKKVLVMGAGPIGALAIAAARASGAAEIVAFDLSERCRRIAVEMGADVAVDASDRAAVAHYSENRGYFDVTLEASGAEAAIESSIFVTRPGGVVVQIGMGKSPLNFPVAQMLVKEISWKGSFRFIDEFTVAVKWLEKGIIDPRPILSGNYDYHDIEAALNAASDKTQHSKVLVQFS